MQIAVCGNSSLNRGRTHEEEQQGRRAKGAMLTTAEEEEEAGSFHPSRLLSFCFLAISFCSF